MGKFSREKGRRNELVLRDELRGQGWSAERVPLSGASACLKGDIIASKDEERVTLELKTRKGGYYDSLYRLHAFLQTLPTDGIEVADTCIATHDTLDAAISREDMTFEHIATHVAKFAPHIRAIGRIWRMRELLGKADILVFRADHKAHVYVRYFLDRRTGE